VFKNPILDLKRFVYIFRSHFSHILLVVHYKLGWIDFFIDSILYLLNLIIFQMPNCLRDLLQTARGIDWKPMAVKVRGVFRRPPEEKLVTIEKAC